MDDSGSALYKLENGVIIERTAEERAQDATEETEPPKSSDHERIEALEQAFDLLISGEVE